MTQEQENKICEEFDRLFTNSFAGDSGMGGNVPQEPVYELATDSPTDIKSFLLQKLHEVETETEPHKGESWRKGYQQGCEETRKGVIEEIIEKINNIPNATRIECEEEKVICVNDLLSSLSPEKKD